MYCKNVYNLCLYFTLNGKSLQNWAKVLQQNKNHKILKIFFLKKHLTAKIKRAINFQMQ